MTETSDYIRAYYCVDCNWHGFDDKEHDALPWCDTEGLGVTYVPREPAD